MRRALRPMPAIALALGLGLAACAGPSATSSDGRVGHPSGEALVMRLEQRGGFVPAEWVFSAVPAFTLVGDGRAIVPGAMIELFPGPLAPPLNVRRLTEEGIASVLAAVGATGQFARNATWDGARDFVADASETVFTVHADGAAVVVSVYALGTFAPGEAPPTLTAEELAAHQALSALADRLGNLDAWIPAAGWADAAWQPYQPAAMRLLVRNADADPPDGSGLPNQLLPWPGAGDPAAFGEPYALLDGARCGVVSGAEARAWYATLAEANQLTRFTAGDRHYQVIPRPLLPDEAAACPEIGAG